MGGERIDGVFEEFERVRVDVAPDRVVATLDHAATKNAIDQRTVDELHALCAWLERRPRILILRGANGLFASGADIAQLRERRRDDALAGINSSIFDRVARLPMPVVAAVEGYALGGGAELALAADFRLASDDLRIGNPEAGLGIIAAAGATWRLRELVGEPIAKEILMAGRVLGAREALDCRLVSEVHPAGELLAAAHALADRIATQDPLAIRLTKAVFHAPRDAHPVVDTIAQAILFESDAKFDRMQAFLDRRAARADGAARSGAPRGSGTSATTGEADGEPGGGRADDGVPRGRGDGKDEG
ncbi:enoyl-CoA hydratase/isomerase family protein [Pseudoclavibacter chungangensis]|uniref:Enoyl-CoA hydratase/isomerase family protein n=1 Tax=Pseudoclavibacter chungangensis TaxID=587635 RepID=A0A7J5C140_9MICO|nr:enoyl-CoA hydratase/isomerase family protein [Pseudoclavibacter chungangensis]KAB1660143.1 enoyl-CoA hydratase/isomerase family protein [Pseudoclavibacter chungangensis]NYJ66749.1 enoyl-CoA hydratase [Pseudoclavibacter chungangensis]